MKTNHITDNEIIDAFGGPSAVAKIFKITPAAVTHWRNPETGMPGYRRELLELKFPKVFKELGKQKAFA